MDEGGREGTEIPGRERADWRGWEGRALQKTNQRKDQKLGAYISGNLRIFALIFQPFDLGFDLYFVEPKLEVAAK